MKYVVTNCYCIGGVWFDSEPMDYDEAVEVYKKIEKQAKRGLRPYFPDLLDENNNVIM